MSAALSESAIVMAVADHAGRRITRKAIAALQRMRVTLSGEDSGLETTWDEICVQVQDEHSFYWDTYDETVWETVRGYVEEMPKHEREAMWLRTEEGIDWDCEEPVVREPYPVCDDDTVQYIIREYVYTAASTWSNARIRAYLDRFAMRD